jgi:hypothetical protein
VIEVNNVPTPAYFKIRVMDISAKIPAAASNSTNPYFTKT